MGQFSWLDCVTNKPILDGVSKTSYVLVPQEFGGGHIEEYRYGGYGNFGGYDIYELVLDWNKKFIPQYMKLMRNGDWECEPSTEDFENLQNYYEGKPISCEDRWLGIILSCYDEDNSRLKYPIKITYDPNVTYEECNYSLSDPNQGWGESEPGAWFYGITGTIPASANKLNKQKVKSIILTALSGGIEGTPDLKIRDAEEDREWSDDPDLPDNWFAVTLNVTLSDADDGEYYMQRLFEGFAKAGYEVDIYYESVSEY